MSGGHGHDRRVEQEDCPVGRRPGGLPRASRRRAAKAPRPRLWPQHIEATNLWSFFQAKTIRQTMMRTAAEAIEAQFKDGGQPCRTAVKTQVEQWRKTAQRYETEPETMRAARSWWRGPRRKEAEREKARAAYHHVRIWLGGLPAGHRAGRRVGAHGRGVACLHLGRPRPRRNGLHLPGLLRADPGPPLGPTKNARRAAVGRHLEDQSRRFSRRGGRFLA